MQEICLIITNIFIHIRRKGACLLPQSDKTGDFTRSQSNWTDWVHVDSYYRTTIICSLSNIHTCGYEVKPSVQFCLIRLYRKGRYPWTTRSHNNSLYRFLLAPASKRRSWNAKINHALVFRSTAEHLPPPCQLFKFLRLFLFKRSLTYSSLSFLYSIFTSSRYRNSTKSSEAIY